MTDLTEVAAMARGWRLRVALVALSPVFIAVAGGFYIAYGVLWLVRR